MKEIYWWVPWFRSLAHRVAEGGPELLVERAKRVEWKEDDSEAPLLRYGDENENIDPFSFFYYLAARSSTAKSRQRIYPSISERFGVSAPDRRCGSPESGGRARSPCDSRPSPAGASTARGQGRGRLAQHDERVAVRFRCASTGGAVPAIGDADDRLDRHMQVAGCEAVDPFTPLRMHPRPGSG